MKIKMLSLIVACLAPAFTVSAQTVTPTPTPTPTAAGTAAATTAAATSASAPLVISPVTQTVSAPATGTLTTAQVVALQTQLAAAGITFSNGQVRSIQIVLPPDLTKPNAKAAYTVTFYPAK